MSEPMSAEQLAAIRRRVEEVADCLAEGLVDDCPEYRDRAVLLAEVERLNRLAQVQSDMISEITAACMATETERDSLRADRASILARAIARSAQLLAARDRCSYDDRVRRRAYEQSAAELRSLIDGIGDGHG